MYQPFSPFLGVAGSNYMKVMRNIYFLTCPEPLRWLFCRIWLVLTFDLELAAVTLTLTFQGHKYAAVNYFPQRIIPYQVAYSYAQYLGRGKRFGQKTKITIIYTAKNPNIVTSCSSYMCGIKTYVTHGRLHNHHCKYPHKNDWSIEQNRAFLLDGFFSKWPLLMWFHK